MNREKTNDFIHRNFHCVLIFVHLSINNNLYKTTSVVKLKQKYIQGVKADKLKPCTYEGTSKR